MINREFQKVSVVSFTTGKDAFGIKRNNGSTSRTVDMVVKIYQQQNTSDARYVNVTDIGLTYDKDINDANQIVVGEDTYDVLYVIPSNRLNQILMKRVK